MELCVFSIYFWNRCLVANEKNKISPKTRTFVYVLHWMYVWMCLSVFVCVSECVWMSAVFHRILPRISKIVMVSSSIFVFEYIFNFLYQYICILFNKCRNLKISIKLRTCERISFKTNGMRRKGKQCTIYAIKFNLINIHKMRIYSEKKKNLKRINSEIV